MPLFIIGGQSLRFTYGYYIFITTINVYSLIISVPSLQHFHEWEIMSQGLKAFSP